MPPLKGPDNIPGQADFSKQTRDKVVARPGPDGKPIYELNGTLVSNDAWEPDPNTMDVIWHPSYAEEIAARQPNPMLGEIGKKQRPSVDEVMRYLNAPQRR